MNRALVGVIAEDLSDVEVIDAIIRKITSAPYTIERFVGHGCGKIRIKCKAWSQNLRGRGCRILIILHDLDDSQPEPLRRSLVAALGVSPIGPHVIIIPIHEIEAWLLADHQAIHKALKLKHNLSTISNPESIMRPKEYLRDIIYRRSGKKVFYINTIHNKKIAQECKVVNLRRCTSFRPLELFLRGHLP